MSDPKPYLPGVLALIAEEIDEDCAIALANARGGRNVFIPKSVEPDHELSRIVGFEKAKQLSELLGGGRLAVPYGSFGGQAGRRAKIETLLQKGLSHSDIAAEVDVSQRTVERIASDYKDPNQTSFDL